MGKPAMSQPGISNKAQQAQEQASAPDLKKPGEEADAIGPRLKPPVAGAVRGGEQTKPGQFPDDEDLAATAPETEVAKTLRQPPGGA